MGPSQPNVIAVTFDVWETLIKDNPRLSDDRAQLRALQMAEVLRRYGYATDPADIRRIYDRTLDRLEQEVWSKYLDVGAREQLSIFLSLFDPHLASSAEETLLVELEEAYTSPIFDLPPTLAPWADWALGAIQRKGLRRGLVCNTGVTPGRDLRKLLEGYGVLGYFQVLSFSDEERVRKPRPEIFERTLKRLGVSPSQAVHIGDDGVADIAGAKGAGMRAILVSTAPPARLPVPPDAWVDGLFAVSEAIEKL